MKQPHVQERLAVDSELMWDIVPVIFGRLRTLNEFRFKTFGVCQDLLLDLAHICNPKEVLITLLAELENESTDSPEDVDGNSNRVKSASSSTEQKYQVDDSCFKAILKPLQHILIKLPNRRLETLKWVFDTLNSHLRKIPVPKNHQLEPGDERLLLEGDLTIRRIHLVLPLYLDFLEAFVDQCKVPRGQPVDRDGEDPKTVAQRDLLLRALIALLHYPLMYLDLDARSSDNDQVETDDNKRNERKVNGKEKEKSSSPRTASKASSSGLLRNPMMVSSIPGPQLTDSLSCAIRTLELIGDIEPNLYKLYSHFDLSDVEAEAFADDVFPSNSCPKNEASYSLGVAAYMTIGQNLWPRAYFVPYVHSHFHTLERHLPLIYVLLERSENMAHEKGLVLAEKLISLIDKNSLSPSFCDLLSKYPIEKSLIKIMRFSSIKQNREHAMYVFKAFINRFTAFGRYQLIYRSLAEPNQNAGVRALSLGLYKGMINEDATCPAYIGKNLHRFLRKAIDVCLPDGAESDLLEQHDTIMGTLNLIRFLCLKDARATNASGVWDMSEAIHKEFLTPLRKAVDLSRAHFLLELKKVETEKKSQPPQKKSLQQKMDIKILNNQPNEQELAALPADHEQQVIKIGLVKLDMVESILVRVNEIME